MKKVKWEITKGDLKHLDFLLDQSKLYSEQALKNGEVNYEVFKCDVDMITFFKCTIIDLIDEINLQK